MKVLRPLLLVALGTAAWANTFNVPFLFDDWESIAQNPTLRPLSTAVFTPVVDSTLAGRPLSNITFALNLAVSGLTLWPMHATNLVLHLLAGLVLMGLVRRTLLLPRFDERIRGSADALSFWAAALWLLHPVQTESVTYLVQRVESLAGFFLLLTLYAALRARQAERPFAWNALAVLACGLGMASKETMSVAPLLLVLFDRAFLFDSWTQAWRERRRLWIAVASTWVVLALQVATGPRKLSAGFNFPGFGPLQYLAIQFGAILHYLRLIVLPIGLVFDYGERGPGGVPLVHSFWQWGPQAAAVLALAAFSVWLWFKRPPAGFLCLAFFLLLGPTTSILPVVSEVISEHRLYLPSAAVIVLLVVSAHLVLPARAKAPIALAAVVMLGVLTFRRNLDYATEQSIWEDTARKRPHSARAWGGVADAHRRAGDRSGDRAEYEQAIRFYRRSMQITPDQVIMLLNLAHCQEKIGALDDALASYQRSLQLEPAQPDALLNYGHALEKRGRLSDAIGAYRRAVELKPQDHGITGDLAVALTRAGKLDEAETWHKRTLELAPNSALAHYNYAALLARAGRYPQALEEFHASAALDPAAAAPWHRAGLVLERMGRPADAVRDLSKSLEIEPNRVEAMLDLAWLLSTNPELRDGKRALALARRAASLAPGQSRPLDVLAAAQAENGDFDNATADAVRALDLAQQHGLATPPLEARLSAYRNKRPWREDPKK